MVNYYTLHIAKPANLTEEQKSSLTGFIKKYNARPVVSKDIVLDFQSPLKLVPANLKKELNGLEVLSVRS